VDVFQLNLQNLKLIVLFTVYMPNYIANFIIVTELSNDFTDLYMKYFYDIP